MQSKEKYVYDILTTQCIMSYVIESVDWFMVYGV